MSNPRHPRHKAPSDGQRRRITEEMLVALRREHQRFQLDEISDGLRSVLVDRMAARMPDFREDVFLCVLVNRILSTAEDLSMKKVEESYRYRRGATSWMEQGIAIRGALTDEGIAALARLAVAARDHHRRLVQLVGRNQ